MYYNTMSNSCDCGYSQNGSSNDLPSKMMGIVDRLESLKSQVGYVDKDSLRQNITQLLCDIDKLHLGDLGIKESGALTDTLKALRTTISSNSTTASLNQTGSPITKVANTLVDVAGELGRTTARAVLNFYGFR